MSKRKHISQRQAMKWRKALNDLRKPGERGVEISSIGNSKMVGLYGVQQTHVAVRTAMACEHLILTYAHPDGSFTFKAWRP